MSVWLDGAVAGFGPLLPEGHEYPKAPPGHWQTVLADPAVSQLVADEDGDLVGFIACGANRDEDAVPEAGEVRTMFVVSRRWRAGVGRALLEAGLDELRRLGYSEATLWSFAGNARANAFYEAHGFERDGAERREEAWAQIIQVRYRRSL
ncbi:MAG TPA: GNAT family N-acetyltransferase [Thermoleophilaceae bacterium]